MIDCYLEHLYGLCPLKQFLIMPVMYTHSGNRGIENTKC